MESTPPPAPPVPEPSEGAGLPVIPIVVALVVAAAVVGALVIFTGGDDDEDDAVATSDTTDESDVSGAGLATDAGADSDAEALAADSGPSTDASGGSDDFSELLEVTDSPDVSDFSDVADVSDESATSDLSDTSDDSASASVLLAASETVESGGELGARSVTVDANDRITLVELPLTRGDAVRVRSEVTDAAPDADAVIVLASGRDDTLRAIEALLTPDDYTDATIGTPEEFLDAVVDDVYDRLLARGSASDGQGDLPFGPGELFEYEVIDDGGRGTPEADWFIAPVDMTLVLGFFEYDGLEASFDVTIHARVDAVPFEGPVGYRDLFDYVEEFPFFSGAFYSQEAGG